jgi:23S rRNA pseudouridine2605 synthase
MSENEDTKERLQKFLARAGVASRRACEKLIEEGRVRVNGQVVLEQGMKIDPLSDRIEFDGETVSADQRSVYILLNKPPSVISAASDPEGRPVVTKLVPAEYGRLYPVGRLDWDSEGALLMTNDGELANMLTHPRHEVAKTYMAKVKGLLPDNDPRLKKLREGVYLDGKKTLPAEIVRDSDTGRHTWFVVSISEGRNRQIRRMFEQVGLLVGRLKRIAYGPVLLGDIYPGDFRRLSEEEVNELYDAAGGSRSELATSRGRLPSHKRKATSKRAHAAKKPAPKKYDPSRERSRSSHGGPRDGDGDKKRGGDTGAKRGGDTGAKRGGDTGAKRGGDTGAKRGGNTGAKRGGDGGNKRGGDGGNKRGGGGNKRGGGGNKR